MIGRPPVPFEDRIERVPFSACWYWTGSFDRQGYGYVQYEGRVQHAHRASYKMHVGPIEPGKCVCHSCDEPSCVNPAHLWIGTHGDNARDREAKRRGRWARRRT